MLMIELKREDTSEGLGFTVAGYRTADGRWVFDIQNDAHSCHCIVPKLVMHPPEASIKYFLVNVNRCDSRSIGLP